MHSLRDFHGQRLHRLNPASGGSKEESPRDA